MATHKPFTEISTLPANANGDVTILEAHLDAAHDSIVTVIEYLAQAVWSSGGVVLPGTVTNPSGALVRVQDRLGVTADTRTLLAVADQAVDLADVPTGTRCLVVIQAKAGASTSHNFLDATTGESITHTLLSAWGRVEIIQGDSSNYPALPTDCVPVAQVTKTGAASLTLDAVATDPPTPRYAGGGGGDGGNDYYDLQMGFIGAPDAAAVDTILAPRSLNISAADPGEVHVGAAPAASVTLGVRRNGVSVGSLQISAAGVATWSIGADISLSVGDRISLVAPDPADATLEDVIVAFRGLAE